MVLFGSIMGRFNSTILTYGLFRVASDVEKLPFPMAPIGAQGIMALAEQQTEEGGSAQAEEGRWRWRVFTIGGVLGLGFGTLYTALPAVSSALLGKPITIFPIPFVDWTEKTADLLPAFATGLSFNLGQVIFGMVLPFFAMLGSFIGLLIMIVANPVLYRFGYLPSWNAGQTTVETLFSNNIDFYFSFSIGISLAIVFAGVWQLYRGLKARAAERRKQQRMRIETDQGRFGSGIREGRGDIPASIVIGTYLVTSAIYILVSMWLIGWDQTGVLIVLLFFAFLYTPFISYATARMEGVAGHVVQIPFVREAAFILPVVVFDV
jgi:hypothetical protein